MMTATHPETLYEQSVRAHVHLGNFPEWLTERKKEAFSRFDALGFPTRRNEGWKYIPLDPILDQNYQHAPADSVQGVSAEDAATVSVGQSEPRVRIAFVNGYFSPDLSSLQALPNGVIVTCLRLALSTHPELVREHLSVDVADTTDPFMALNTALFESGAFVYIPKETVLDTPIHVQYITHNQTDLPQVTYPRSLFIVEERSKVSFVTSYVGCSDKPSAVFNNAVTELYVGDSATVEHVHLQDDQANAYHLSHTHACVLGHGQLLVNSFPLGSHISRHGITVDLNAEGASCELNSLSVLNHGIESYDYSVINHWKPHCRSEQLYKSILEGASVSEFNGTVVIPKDSQQSDAAQLNKNLLLSDKATVHTRPQLKIDADDVTCAHGATVGQLEEEELFYLQSRGLPPEEARALLIQGFAMDVIERSHLLDVKQHVSKRTQDNLKGTSAHDKRA